ncbi:MAG: DNA primase [Acidimicrobiia bacterium]|nr:DNA primase [Acidimicrobiia bacterium]MBT8192069.1 DNA primase [Acidimicrobiia bacterium]NNF87043.1 DNA primase [Acidimicrobiia bacterium]NNJ46801.1 DNA primase [Acidimicrobiia bacterium]NNL14097.1 DNA primase [Acidimicrobiia bacterium]
MAFQREDIERVRAATNLVELVGEVTKVKPSGRNVMAVCPFHQEKTPSMSVDAAKGVYHCFGCGEGGDIFKFVEQTQALNFNEAVELLARRAGIQLRIDPDAQKRRGERESLIEAVGAAIEFYHERLRKADDAASARRYLRSRGYEADIVEQFQLGYSPEGFTALYDHLRNDRKMLDKVMEKSGLVARNQRGRFYDRFRGRVMFPIYDLRGDPVGFGARLLDGEGPKYLNSPETSIYRKSNLLYGLNWSKSDMVKQGVAVVVEGYTDVIAVHQAGVPAVATCGTAFGASHLDLLRRFTERVVLAFDADEAGTGAALRGFEHSVPGDLDLRVAPLPAGRDPGDLVEAGEVDILRQAVSVESSVPLLQFRLERELDQHRLDEPEARGRAIKAAATIVARHPDMVTRHEYAVFLSRKTGVDLPVIEQAVSRASRTAEREPAGTPAPEYRTPESGRGRAEQEYLRLMLANDASLAGADLEPEAFADSKHREAFELLRPIIGELEPDAVPELGSVIGDDSGEVASLLRHLAVVDRPLAEAPGLARRITVWQLEDRIKALQTQLATVSSEEDRSHATRELLGLLEKKQQLLGE